MDNVYLFEIELFCFIPHALIIKSFIKFVIFENLHRTKGRSFRLFSKSLPDRSIWDHTVSNSLVLYLILGFLDVIQNFIVSLDSFIYCNN